MKSTIVFQTKSLSSQLRFAERYEVSERTTEIVRSQMQKLGLIKRISHFNPGFGNQSGWTFSPKFRHCLNSFSEILKAIAAVSARKLDQKKDQEAIHEHLIGRIPDH